MNNKKIQPKKVDKKKSKKNNKKIQKHYQPIETKKVKVRKIKFGRILLTLLVLFLLFYLITHLINFPIKNIYIHNNDELTDQQIIKEAGLKYYPSIFYKTSYSIEKKLEKNILIKKATVKKKNLKEINIYIEDNYPIFYDTSSSMTVFQDSRKTADLYGAPTLINYVPNTIYDTLIEKMNTIDESILKRISEIKYDPNTVDQERFLITMSDGNYVYLTLETFENINSYVSIYLDIVEKYGNKKGILYLDSGEYFEIIN